MPSISTEMAADATDVPFEPLTFSTDPTGELPTVTVDPTKPADAVAALAGRVRCINCGTPLETIISHRHHRGPQATELCLECDPDDEDEASLTIGRADGTGTELWGNVVRPGAEHSTPLSAGHSRWVCISDTHGKHRELSALPAGDVLVHAGDFTMTGLLDEIEDFVEWFAAVPGFKHKVVIAGNHEPTLDVPYYADNWRKFHPGQQISPDNGLPIGDPNAPGKQDAASAQELLRTNSSFTYLEDTADTVLGYKVYGSPWTPHIVPKVRSWGFGVDRGTEAANVWEAVPTDTDVLITHGPPAGHGDLVNGEQLGRAGDVNLLAEVTERVQPLYHVFGHTHHGHGFTTNGITRFVNAAVCDDAYFPSQPPLCFDLPPKD